jgi:signal transduction histidine kinase/ligand-binding sensor domain-containing protein
MKKCIQLIPPDLGVIRMSRMRQLASWDVRTVTSLRTRLVFAVVYTALLLCPPLNALDPTLRLSQYGHTAWRVREAYFSGSPLTIAQTRDGQLWIGGEGGLVRFDGVHFLPPPEGMHLPDFGIFSLLGASDGSLWVGMGSGLARWKDGKLTFYAKSGRFGALLEDRQGTLWAGHTRALNEIPPLCRFAAGEFKCFRVPEKSPLRYVAALEEDAQGNLWVGGEGAVCRWQAEAPDCYEVPKQPRGNRFGIYGLASDAKGDIWIGAGASGVWRLTSGHWQPDTDLPGRKVESAAIFKDREGSLWIGDEANGIIRRVDGVVDRFTRNEGLSGNSINDVFEDREGNLWVATSGGLDRFRDVKVATLVPNQDLPLESVWSVVSSRRGGLWISGSDTLVHLNQDGTTTYTSGSSLAGKIVGNLFEDHRGRLWVGIGDSLFWRDQERFHKLRLPEACDGTTQVRAMAEEADDTLWASATGRGCGLIRIRKDEVVEVLSRQQLGDQVNVMASDPEGGVWLGLANHQLKHYRDGRLELRREQIATSLTNMLADTNGLWVATNEGLAFHNGDKFAKLDSNNGLPCNFIEAVLKDDNGALWLKSRCAVVHVPVEELAKWLKDPGRQLRLEVWDSFDGVQAGGSAFGQHAAKSTDGRLWFAIVSGGLQVFDPSRAVGNTLAPPVHILRVAADHKPYGLGSDLRLPALTKTLEIGYTAYSLSVPEKVRFRYKLDGYDKDWSGSVSLREVTYTNLPPGNYEFHVLACNNDGVWNETGARLTFNIPPSFTQSTLFKTLCALSGLGILSLAYRMRVKHVTQRLQDRMCERMAERARIARDLHDTFFQGVQGLFLRFHTATSQLPKSESARGIFEDTLRQSDQVMKEGRELLLDLRTSANSRDLPRALAEAGRQFQELYPCEFNVIVNGDVRALDPIVSDELFQIGKESLSNAFQHSGANQIEAEVHYEAEQLRLRIRDDGTGIDPKILEQGHRTGHWGLPGMRERARKIGTRIEAWSQSGAGTEVELRVPARLAYAPDDEKRATAWIRKIWKVQRPAN